MERIWQFWRRLSAREQLLVGGGALAILLVVLVFYVWQPLEKARAGLRARLPAMRAEAQQMRTAVTEVAQLKRIQHVPPQGNFREMLEQSAAAHGLPLTQANPEGAAKLNVVFASVAFDSWVKWLADLQAQRVRLESCRIDALPQAGMVKVQALFARG